MNITLIARLVIAHVLGDFILQSDRWVAEKHDRHFFSPYLYLHGLVHLILAWLAVGEWRGWIIAAPIAFGHILFDGLKGLLKKKGIGSFLIDQTAHALVIIACWMLYTDVRLADITYSFNNERFWIITATYFTVTFVYQRLIAIATTIWRKDIPAERALLLKAGRWIGIIERTLVLTFVLMNQFAAIGFLLAAKSIFRFGDLRDAKDKSHTEYVLIGTLLSFGLTIITGILVSRLLGNSA